MRVVLADAEELFKATAAETVARMNEAKARVREKVAL
jgi:hypothetical protein